jgi:hypothetical protein
MLDSPAKLLPIAPWQRKRALWHYPAAIIAGILALATLATLVQHEKGRRVYKKVVNEIVCRFRAPTDRGRPWRSRPR